jgi:hypothetical protein
LIYVTYCKRTSVHFLTSPLLSYSPPVDMYSFSSPLYHLQGLHPKLMTSTLMARWLPRCRLTRSRQLLCSSIARTWMAPDEPRTHRDRSAWHYGTLHHHADTQIWEAWYCNPLYIICRLT